MQMCSIRNNHSFLVIMQHGTARVTVAKLNSLSLLSSNHDPRCWFYLFKNLHLHKNLHVNVYCTFIHNCPKLDTTKISFNMWMDKQTVVFLCNEILFSNIIRWAIKQQKDLKETNAFFEGKNQSEKATYSMNQLDDIWKSQNYSDGKKTSNLQRFGGRREVNRWSIEIWGSSETIPYGTVVINIHYTILLSKPTELYRKKEWNFVYINTNMGKTI